MQETNIPLLSTRMLDDALITRAAENRLAIRCVSFIETRHLQSEVLQQRLHSLVNKLAIAVFTSMNAVNAVASQLPVVPPWKVFCTGGITKEYAIKYFGEEAIVATAKNATILAEKIIAANINGVTFFCGDQRLNDLPETLEAHGKAIEEMVVYTTAPTPVFIEENYAGILFFSPSAVHSFFSLNTIPTSTILFAIGHTTAAAIHSYCTNKVITSEWPGAESMVDLLIKYYK